MFFFQFEARPKKTYPNRHEYGGAVVTCWVQRQTHRQAEAFARGLLADEGWRISAVDEAARITRADQRPEGMKYFEQAERDGEVFLFYTWPVGAPDDGSS